MNGKSIYEPFTTTTELPSCGYAGINVKMERGGVGHRWGIRIFGNFLVKFPTLGTEERFNCDQMPLSMRKKKHTDL